MTLMREPVNIGPMRLPGEYTTVQQALGVVVFAHGSGSEHASPRNRFVADVLHGYRLSTLLFNLLSGAEARDRAKVFDIALLAARVGEAIDWTQTNEGGARRGIGVFGASTGAAAALCAAAGRPGRVAALVSRGGRPDLAEPLLAQVQAPTLLIVGANDAVVLGLNRDAMRRLHCEKRLEVVPSATHLFVEPGALDTVAHLAGAWFANHLAGGARHA